MTLLSICQAVIDEIGENRPTSIINSSDPVARRLVAAANAEGLALSRAHLWSILQREHTFTTSVDVDAYQLPADFYKLTQSTAWNRSDFRQMTAGMSPAQWQRAKGYLTSSPSGYYQIRILSGPLTGSVLVDPVPAGALDLVYEYQSAWWCQSSGGTGQAAWAADTDVPVLDAELMRLGILWRMRRILGMAYSDDRADAEIALRAAIVADLALQPGNLAPTVTFPYPAVPEGSWVTA